MKRREFRVKESITNKKILTVMFGLLCVGGGAALLAIYSAEKNAGRQPGYRTEEHDGDIFVCGAHA
jgi:hypothetical protein